MLRTALRPRYLGLLALMVAATVLCGLLASWQWDRAHRAITEQQGAPEHLGSLPEVIGVSDPVTNDIVGSAVDATGTFDASEQVVVTGRVIDGQDAVIVVTALHVRTADGEQARLAVARGWMPASEARGADGEVDPSAVPAPARGEVRITGLLEASEAASGGVSGGVAPEISAPMLVNEWGAPMYTGYLAQTSPADDLAPMPEATSAFRAGMDWQNLGYALQWVLFGAFFLYLWWRTVRTAHREEVEDRRAAALAALDTDSED